MCSWNPQLPLNTPVPYFLGKEFNLGDFEPPILLISAATAVVLSLLNWKAACSSRMFNNIVHMPMASSFQGCPSSSNFLVNIHCPHPRVDASVWMIMQEVGEVMSWDECGMFSMHHVSSSTELDGCQSHTRFVIPLVCYQGIGFCPSSCLSISPNFCHICSLVTAIIK